MKATLDSVGRGVLPEALRDALGSRPGVVVDISAYGAGPHLVPSGRTPRLVEEDGVLVATGETVIDDDRVLLPRRVPTGADRLAPDTSVAVTTPLCC